MHAGTLIRYRLALRRAPISWLTRIEEWQPPHRFVDMQIRGPYALWHHTHEFEAIDDCRTCMTDVVRYAQRFGPAGEIAQRLFVQRDVERIFDFRRDAIAELLTVQAAA
jgi:ligand-binding SRPBCC domain-containing protein